MATNRPTTIDPNDILQGNEALDQFNDKLDNTLDIAEDFHKILLEQVKALKAAREESKNVYDLQKQLNDLTKKQSDIIAKKASLENQANTEAQKAIDIIKKGFEARRKQGEELTKLATIQTRLNSAELAANAQSIDGQKLIADLRQKAKDQQDTIVRLNKEENALSDILLQNYQKQNLQLNEADEKIVQQYLNQQKLGEELKEYLKNHNIDLNTQQDIIDAQKSQMSNMQKINQYLEFHGKKLKEFEKTQFGKFISAQLDAIGISFSSIVKNVMAFDQTLTDSAKQLGISKDGARVLAGEYEKTSDNAKDFNSNAEQTLMTQKAQFEAQSQLNASLGTAGLFTAKSRIDQAFLTKQVGLQGEEAAKIYQLGKLSGLDAEKTSKIIAQEVINSGKQNGNKLDYKKILQDVSKIEGQLAVQYQNNPELIAKAVTQAKQLGLELQQTSKMADSLLNFENSISNELKAELLTGKALNLEKARELALRGDSASAAKELMDNVGGLSEFQNLNVLQQRSLAEAIGLSADELSNALKTQELLKGTAFETQEAFEEAARNAKTEDERQVLFAQLRQADNAEQLIKQASQISNQEKFNSLIEKLQETITSVAEGPLGSLISGFANLLQNATSLKIIVGAISTIMAVSWVGSIAKSIIALKPLLVELGFIAAEATITNSMLSFGVGVAIALAALGGTFAAISSMSGDSISVPSAGGGGVNTDNIVRPNQYQLTNSQASNQSDRPVNLNVNVGGKNVATVNDALRSNSSYAV
jgi:hypothetical protein